MILESESVTERSAMTFLIALTENATPKLF
jgi:hypothetical protein